MVGFKFQRPIGASADEAELEYISALMQTDPEGMRRDGHLKAEDVALYLNSRFGIDISKEDVEEEIFSDFGEDGSIDMVQLVAILLIPKLNQEATKDNTSSLLSELLASILQDLNPGQAIGRRTPKPALTTAFLSQVLISLGETELAERTELLEDMVHCVGENADGSTVRFDTVDFARALTHDVPFDRNNATETASIALSEEAAPPNSGVLSGAASDDESDDESVHLTWATLNCANLWKYLKYLFRTVTRPDDGEEGVVAKTYPRKFTAPFIDLAADNYRSRTLLVLLWVSFVLSFFTYYSGIGTFLTSQCPAFENRKTWREQSLNFVCHVGWALLRWTYVLCVMSVYGLAYFCFAGMSNGSENKRYEIPLTAALIAALYTYVPPIAFRNLDFPGEQFLKTIGVLLGTAVVMMNLWTAASLADPDRVENFRERARAFLNLPAEPAMPANMASKVKIDRLVYNAENLQNSRNTDRNLHSNLGMALANYEEEAAEPPKEEVGGFAWTWQGMWNRKLIDLEGIWLSGRLVSIEVSQFITAVFIGVLGFLSTGIVVKNYSPPNTGFQVVLESLFNFRVDEALKSQLVRVVGFAVASFVVDEAECNKADQDEATANLCQILANSTDVDTDEQIDLLRDAGFEIDDITNTTAAALVEAAVDAVNTLYPEEKYMLFIPMFLGTVTACATAVYVAAVLLPSITTTTLKFRCGIIPLMHDPKHKTVRIAPDQTAFLQGAMFWGLLVSAALSSAVVAGLAFLFVWQVTTKIAQTIMAFILGVIAVVTFHWLLVRRCRGYTSKSYYRAKPLYANIVLLARECAFFSLSVGFTLVRATKLLFTTLLFIGRIDKPFLNDGIGEIEALGFRLDNHPFVVRMDILQHEAHRHPWIETFGEMIMLKLSRDEFGTKAGSAWRLVFVLALMPWLAKYRALTRPEMRESDEEFASKRGVASCRSFIGSIRSPTSTRTFKDAVRAAQYLRLQQLEKRNEELLAELEKLRGPESTVERVTGKTVANYIPVGKRADPESPKKPGPVRRTASMGLQERPPSTSSASRLEIEAHDLSEETKVEEGHDHDLQLTVEDDFVELETPRMQGGTLSEPNSFEGRNET